MLYVGEGGGGDGVCVGGHGGDGVCVIGGVDVTGDGVVAGVAVVVCVVATGELSATVACAHSSDMRVAADTPLTEEVAATAGAVLPEDTPETAVTE